MLKRSSFFLSLLQITREGRTKLIGVIRDVGKTGPFESGIPSSPVPITTAQAAPTAVAATG